MNRPTQLTVLALLLLAAAPAGAVEWDLAYSESGVQNAVVRLLGAQGVTIAPADVVTTPRKPKLWVDTGNSGHTVVDWRVQLPGSNDPGAYVSGHTNVEVRVPRSTNVQTYDVQSAPLIDLVSPRAQPLLAAAQQQKVITDRETAAAAQAAAADKAKIEEAQRQLAGARKLAELRFRALLTDKGSTLLPAIEHVEVADPSKIVLRTSGVFKQAGTWASAHAEFPLGTASGQLTLGTPALHQTVEHPGLVDRVKARFRAKAATRAAFPR